MAKQENRVGLFNLEENYSGGGSFFADGPYRIEESRFTLFDFNGKAADGPACCLMQTLQPLNSAGKDAGEQVVRYWPAGNGFAPTKDGTGLVATGEYQTLWKGSDFFIYMENLAKAGFDMAEANDDISVLDGLVAEFGKVTKPGAEKAAAKEDGDGKKKYPAQVIVITDIPAQGKSSGKAASGKSAPAASGKKGAAKNEEEADPETLLEKYLTDELLVDKNEKGIKKMAARLGLGKWLAAQGHDADVVRAVQGVFNSDKLATLLESAGWETKGDLIKLAS